MVEPQAPPGAAWEAAFYSASFTHPNPFNRKLTSYKRGNDALWKALMTNKKRREFPLEVLLPTNKTLAEAMKNITK